jgi:succinylglutamate desuccinylase
MALDILFKMLQVEPITNPDFRFRGKMVGIRGNLHAIQKEVRFIKKDLNRALKPDDVERVLKSDPSTLDAEDYEMFHLVNAVSKEIEETPNERVFILDLHTTTATGGIFTLTADDTRSIEVGVAMHAPVIIGFEQMLKGTTMGYFKPKHFNGRKITSVVFEGGQHVDPLSVNRCIAATINCMRTIGCVRPEDVENRHDHLLIEYSEGLPKVARLIERYGVQEDSHFVMAPGFRNFDWVEKGQIMAHLDGEPVYSPQDGMIIMPKYQEQGDDGFFLVEREIVESATSS